MLCAFIHIERDDANSDRDRLRNYIVCKRKMREGCDTEKGHIYQQYPHFNLNIIIL